MLLGRMKKYLYKKTIFECIIYYGDHLLIIENPEEPGRVMDIWNRQDWKVPDLAELCTCVWSHWSWWCMQGSKTDVYVSAG